VVERDLSALSHAERSAALEADAPELLALLGDVESGLGEVRLCVCDFVCMCVCKFCVRTFARV
jgi:hypothetical protein